MERQFREFSKFREFDKSLKHGLGQFQDPVSHMCLAGSVVASWAVTWGGGFEPFYCEDKYFSHWIQQIHWKHLGKTQISMISIIPSSIQRYLLKLHKLWKRGCTDQFVQTLSVLIPYNFRNDQGIYWHSKRKYKISQS